MKINVKEGEGFLKFFITESGGIGVDYGYNIGPLVEDMLSGELDDTLTSKLMLVTLVAGTATKIRADAEHFMDIGAEAIDAGFLEGDNNLLAGEGELTDEQIDLMLMDVEGNA